MLLQIKRNHTKLAVMFTLMFSVGFSFAYPGSNARKEYVDKCYKKKEAQYMENLPNKNMSVNLQVEAHAPMGSFPSCRTQTRSNRQQKHVDPKIYHPADNPSCVVASGWHPDRCNVSCGFDRNTSNVWIEISARGKGCKYANTCVGKVKQNFRFNNSLSVIPQSERNRMILECVDEFNRKQQ